jgi:hypothetical protein
MSFNELRNSRGKAGIIYSDWEHSNGNIEDQMDILVLKTKKTENQILSIR